MANNYAHPYATKWKNYTFKPLRLTEGRHYSQLTNGTSPVVAQGGTLWVSSEHILSGNVLTYRVVFGTNSIKLLRLPRKWAGDGTDSGSVDVTHDFTLKNDAATLGVGHAPGTFQCPRDTGTDDAIRIHGNQDGGGYINNSGNACSVISLAPGLHFCYNNKATLATDNDYLHYEMTSEQRDNIAQDLKKNKIMGLQSCWIQYPEDGDFVSTGYLPLTTPFPNGNFIFNNSRVIIRPKTGIGTTLAGLSIRLKPSMIGSEDNANSDWGALGAPVGGDPLVNVQGLSADIDYITTNFDPAIGAQNHMICTYLSMYNQEYRQDFRFYRLTADGAGNQNADIPPGQFFEVVYQPTHN
jgi:hypothetical protein